MHTVEQILIDTFQLLVTIPLDALEHAVGMVSQDEPNWHNKKGNKANHNCPLFWVILISQLFLKNFLCLGMSCMYFIWKVQLSVQMITVWIHKYNKNFRILNLWFNKKSKTNAIFQDLQESHFASNFWRHAHNYYGTENGLLLRNECIRLQRSYLIIFKWDYVEKNKFLVFKKNK